MDIIHRSAPLVADFHPTSILYIGGTCDLTLKDHYTKMIQPRYDNYADLCSSMISLFKNARKETEKLFPDYKIAF